uniref:Uncharacterized protein n=1 Tax=Anguilla anguilla TaxID=7936 RepID=A0A0E9QNW9_ANGAN
MRFFNTPHNVLLAVPPPGTCEVYQRVSQT